MAQRTPATTVLTPAQIRTLASPARLEIIEAFGALRRASARELAAHLGRSPGAVYHHLRALEHAGVVREVERRPGPRRPEAIYEPVAERLAVSAGKRLGDQETLVRTLQVVLRQAARDADGMFAEGAEALQGRFHGLQLSGALRASEIQRVLALLEELEAVFRKANRTRSRAGEIFRWTSLFMPIGRRRS